MSAPDPSPAGRLQSGAERPARLVRTICQMILGAGLAVALILKVYMVVLTDHACTADASSLGNAIRCTPSLMLMAYALALSAAFDLAYRFFREGIDQAISPMILAVSAALLGVLGHVQSGNVGWREAILMLALVGAIAGLVWIRANFVTEKK